MKRNYEELERKREADRAKSSADYEKALKYGISTHFFNFFFQIFSIFSKKNILFIFLGDAYKNKRDALDKKFTECEAEKDSLQRALGALKQQVLIISNSNFFISFHFFSNFFSKFFGIFSKCFKKISVQSESKYQALEGKYHSFQEQFKDEVQQRKHAESDLAYWKNRRQPPPAGTFLKKN